MFGCLSHLFLHDVLSVHGVQHGLDVLEKSRNVGYESLVLSCEVGEVDVFLTDVFQWGFYFLSFWCVFEL